jgi:hypothetical protein
MDGGSDLHLATSEEAHKIHKIYKCVLKHDIKVIET